MYRGEGDTYINVVGFIGGPGPYATSNTVHRLVSSIGGIVGNAQRKQLQPGLRFSI